MASMKVYIDNEELPRAMTSDEQNEVIELAPREFGYVTEVNWYSGNGSGLIFTIDMDLDKSVYKTRYGANILKWLKSYITKEYHVIAFWDFADEEWIRQCSEPVLDDARVYAINESRFSEEVVGIFDPTQLDNVNPLDPPTPKELWFYGHSYRFGVKATTDGQYAWKQHKGNEQ